jgi:hypothetical protein
MSSSNFFLSFQVEVTTNYYSNPAAYTTPRAYSQYLSLVSASIPVSFYNVRNGLLEFTYRLTGETTDRTTTLDIGAGQYSATDLVSLVSLSGFLPTLTTTPFTSFVRYEPTKNKFIFYFAAIPGLDYFYLVPGALATQMGFVNATNGVFPTATDTKYTGFDSVESDQVVDLSGIRNIYVLTNYYVRQFNGGTPVLARIPIDQPFGSRIFFDDDFANQMYWSAIGDIEVWFVDDDGNEVDFNGVPWNLTLQFDFRPPDTHPPYFDETDPFLNITSLV